MSHSCYCGGEACGCCCGDGSTADDDGSTADGMMRWLRSDGYASNKAAGCEDRGGYWGCIGCLKQQCCVGDLSSHVAMSHGSSSQVAMLHESNSLVISCEENHGRLDHGRLDVHSSSLRSTEKS